MKLINLTHLVTQETHSAVTNKARKTAIHVSVIMSDETRSV